ncbi:MAG: hypothetical protein RLP44_19615 [Aggregatilineales bacterium]
MPFYQYPLNLRFKLIALAPRIIVTDATGKEVLFISQKIFKLKEDIRIYTNQSKEKELFNIRAEKILDFNTRYNFVYAVQDQHIGSVKAKGWRSIWSATYLLDDPNSNTTHYIKEDNPWVKVGDALFQQIPLVGALGGYVFHPSYTCYAGSDFEDKSHPVMQIKKEAAFFEGVYSINLIDQNLDRVEEMRAVLSFMLMVQFMRRRG